MKKILLSIIAILAFGISQAQNLATENFDTFPASWTTLNQSAPSGANLWAAATAGQQEYFNGGAGAYNGTAATSYALVNFNSTTGGTGTISNWLITPVINVMNGDVITFYAIKGLSGGTSVYADGMQVRLSTVGAASTNPVGASGVGSYTTIMHDINPMLNATDFPTTWTQYIYTVSGLTGATDVRVAFRYFVTNAGPTGSNSDQIGIDQFSVDRPLSTENFAKNNFTVYPNPATDVINISNVNGLEITKSTITDINGRIVKEINSSVKTINVGDLSTGVYFLNVTTTTGNGTTKIVKK